MGWFSDFFSDPFSTVIDTVTENAIPVITAGAQLATGNVAGAALTVGSTIAKNTRGDDVISPPRPIAKSSQGLGFASTVAGSNRGEAPISSMSSSQNDGVETTQKASQPVVYVSPPSQQINYTPLIFIAMGFIVLSRMK